MEKNHKLFTISHFKMLKKKSLKTFLLLNTYGEP